jgi:NAD-dependent SIR2 family protein deacetylase
MTHRKGAGVSVNAGIPDFRSKDGLFNNLREFNVPSPEYIFDIQYFRYNPDPFYKVSKKIYPTNFKPTKSHAFIKKLEDLGVLLRCYTQNIDGLERFPNL